MTTRVSHSFLEAETFHKKTDWRDGVSVETWTLVSVCSQCEGCVCVCVCVCVVRGAGGVVFTWILRALIPPDLWEHGSSSFCGVLRCPSNLSYPAPCHVTPVVWGHCHLSPWKQASPNTSHPTTLLHNGCLLRELLKIFSLLTIYTYWEWSVLMCMIWGRKFEVSKWDRWAGLKDLR